MADNTTFTSVKPPSDMDAERSLLGSVLLNSKVLEDIADIIKFEHYYDQRHQIVFRVMIELWSASKPVDIIFLLEELKLTKGITDEELNSIDKDFLLDLISRASLMSNPANTAKIIRDKYFLRKLIDIADHVKAKSFEENERVEDVLEYAQREIYEVGQSNIDKTFAPISEVLSTVFGRISTAADSDSDMVGMPTGLTDLDGILGGLHRSDLIILAARPSMGKTSLVLEIVRRMATHHKTAVAIFSLEMGREQLVDKLISSASGIELRKIRNSQLENNDGNDEFMKLGEAIAQLDASNIWIDDSGHLTITELRTKARRLKSRYQIDMIVIDYLQLMSGNSGTNYGVNRNQEVSDISRNLKMMAKELDIPIIALSQLSRGVESRDDKRPMLSDLRESGSIEQDADIVMFVHREEMYNKETKNKGKANIIIAKHRNGETGTIELAWIGRLATFANLDGARTSHRVEK
jgi:replicative DNA helicase